VNGHSYAGGTEILQATDIRVVAEAAAPPPEAQRFG